MIPMITLNYYTQAEEVRPRFLRGYHNEDDVIKLDSLLDAMYYLESEYNRVHERVYPKTKKTKYISKYEQKLTSEEHQELVRYDEIRDRVAQIVYEERKNGTTE